MDRLARAAPELVLMALAAIMFVQAGNFAYVPRPGQLGPDFWPRAMTVGLFIACAARLIQKLAGRDARPRRDEAAVPMDRRWLTIGIALAIGYAAGTVVIGYLLATATFLTIFLWIGGQRRWFVPPLAAAAALAFSYVFLKLVYVSLPTGWGAFDDFTVTVYQWLGIF